MTDHKKIDTFENEKRNILGRLDKSPKGSFDERIIPLLDLLNSHSNYVTSSSCSGRICVSSCDDLGQKGAYTWEFVSHDPVESTSLIEYCAKPTNKQIWLTQESFILHVRCKDIDSADVLIRTAKSIGLRRCALVVIESPLVEIICSRSINTLVSHEGKQLLSSDGIIAWSHIANTNLMKNHALIKAFFDAVQKLFKP